jgi:adenosyl cobinamide kinase/adenosyl cobinamide phosphate guanylyltransferase
MEVCLAGTGASSGWPEPGCGCASCARVRASGRTRAPARVVVDGVLRIGSGRPPPGYQVQRLPGAWDVTAPDGGRLLVADGSGVTPEPPAGSRPYDIVLLDLLNDPAQLGALRSRELVPARTVVALLHADHRVSSEGELARRCGFWGVLVPGDGDVLTAPAGAASTSGDPARAAGTEPAHSAGTEPAGRPGQPRRVLVLGGARSGKSRHAELRLAAEPRVTYLAAGPFPPGAQPTGDSDWAERVAAHQSRRPRWWQTVESIDAAAVLRSESGAVLFDGAGTWLAAVMEQSGAWADGAERGPGGPAALAHIAEKADELVEAWRRTRARVVAVSDEVGSSIHPPTRAGRLFRDQLGWLNQRLAAESDETVLVVAGRPLTLPS